MAGRARPGARPGGDPRAARVPPLRLRHRRRQRALARPGRARLPRRPRCRAPPVPRSPRRQDRRHDRAPARRAGRAHRGGSGASRRRRGHRPGERRRDQPAPHGDTQRPVRSRARSHRARRRPRSRGGYGRDHTPVRGSADAVGPEVQLPSAARSGPPAGRAHGRAARPARGRRRSRPSPEHAPVVLGVRPHEDGDRPHRRDAVLARGLRAGLRGHEAARRARGGPEHPHALAGSRDAGAPAAGRPAAGRLRAALDSRASPERVAAARRGGRGISGSRRVQRPQPSQSVHPGGEVPDRGTGRRREPARFLALYADALRGITRRQRTHRVSGLARRGCHGHHASRTVHGGHGARRSGRVLHPRALPRDR